MKKVLFAALSAVVGAGVSVALMGKMTKDAVQAEEKRVNKFRSYYDILNQWLRFQHSDKKLEEFFVKNNYRKVAIYGMGELGNRLLEELKNSSVSVEYGVDKNVSEVRSDITVYQLDEELPEVDAVIVTAVFAFDKVVEDLAGKFDCEIISLEDVVFGI